MSSLVLNMLFPLVLLSSSAVTVTGWLCDCEEHVVGCNVYGFGTVFYDSLEENVYTGNLLVSPLGLWVGLLYTYVASVGDAKSALLKALFPKREKTCVVDKAVFTHYKATTAKYMDFEESTAPFYVRTNTSYANVNKTEPQKPYLDSLPLIPAGKVATANFSNGVEAIGEQIVTYSNKGTFMQDGDVTNTTEFVILNMLKFHAKWKIPFTQEKEFSHKGKHFSMMSAHGNFINGYDKTNDTSYLYLEFDTKGLMMVMVLSDFNERPAPNWDKFDPKNNKPKYQKVSIPKFKFQTEYSLKKVIKGLKCDILYNSEKSNITGIHGVGATISQVVQKTQISIDKNGVMFEAFTAIVGDQSPKPREQEYEHKEYNKPFMFYLFAHETLVAQGRVMDPSY